VAPAGRPMTPLILALSILVPRVAATTSPRCANHTCPRLQVPISQQQPAHGGRRGNSSSSSSSSASGGLQDCCQHKPLLPIGAADVQTTVALFFGLSLASAGGVGGGALVVPILILLENFGPSAAVPFAQLCGFATALPRLAMVVGKSHPRSLQRPLIDFESFVVLTPATLIGNLIGVHMNVTVPPVLLLGIMVLLLSVVGVRMLRKGIAMWRKDTAITQRQPLLRGVQIPEGAAACPSTSSSLQHIAAGGSSDRISENFHQDPCIAVASVTALFATISIFSYLRGAAGRPSPVGLALCSWQFWALDAGSMMCLCAHLALSATLTVRRHRRRSQGSDTDAMYAEGEVQWSAGSTARFGACVCVAGFASAFLGVGGGIVIGFLLHEMALLPQVASATVTLITTFSCGSNCVQYFLRGRLPLDWAALFFGVSLVGGWFGMMAVTRLVARFRSGSLVVMALALMVLIADGLLTGIGVGHIVDTLKAGNEIDFTFHSPCDTRAHSSKPF
jgi:uncharacterized membrane protein YfcA